MTITTSPTTPAPGAAVTITSSANIRPKANHVVLELTSVPPLSALSTGLVLLESDDPPTEPLEAVRLNLDTNVFTPDVAGDYGLRIYNVFQFPPLSFVLGNDDGSTDTIIRLRGYEEVTLQVGALVELPILTTGGHGATLKLQINDDTIQDATLIDPTSEVARVAALQTGVTTPLGLLVSETVAAVGTALQGGANDLRTNYEAHRVMTGGAVHTAADATNTVVTDDADSQEGAIALLNELRSKILAHAQESSAAPTAWHVEDDLKNTPMAGPATDVATATVLSADLRERVYELHRMQDTNPNVHDAAVDNTNTLNAPSKLDDLVVAFLNAIADVDPTAPTGESEGAQDAGHRYGFLPV